MPDDLIERLLVTTAAALLGALGLLLLFGADTAAARLGAPSAPVEMLAQLAASGLLGLGAINWLWRGSRLGGIYGRPLGLGNLLFFVSAGAALGRTTLAGHLPAATWLVVLALGTLALAFAWRLFLWRPAT